ncbi:MAG: CYTH domain-containing protein [Actinomycetota bacterium]|nr:CYTH domain-containing protein [Actinomycetota bacterium]
MAENQATPDREPPETPTEIERKFVLDAVPSAHLPADGGRRIEQGYVDDDAELRLRRVDGRCVLTVKTGGGMVRGEVEGEVDEDLFDALWALTEGRRLTKTRHEVPLDDGLVAEVDVYDGALDGLVVGEVELGSLDEAARFEPPAWLGREVTGDKRWSNRSLADRGRP